VARNLVLAAASSDQRRQLLPLPLVEGSKELRQHMSAFVTDASRDPPAARRQAQRAFAPVGAASSVDQTLGVQPVDQPHGRRVRQADDHPQPLDADLPVAMGQQRRERHRGRAAAAGGSLRRGAQPVGEREREGTEEVLRSRQRGHHRASMHAECTVGHVLGTRAPAASGGNGA
jgi:hypothetical protein